MPPRGTQNHEALFLLNLHHRCRCKTQNRKFNPVQNTQSTKTDITKNEHPRSRMPMPTAPEKLHLSRENWTDGCSPFYPIPVRSRMLVEQVWPFDVRATSFLITTPHNGSLALVSAAPRIKQLQPLASHHHPIHLDSKRPLPVPYTSSLRATSGPCDLHFDNMTLLRTIRQRKAGYGRDGTLGKSWIE
ncbi:hypothetical protein Moror_15350 [Moniliophthora roreri MCA 2997]|uniref:Uncharacterized protein n=1 Tax=Moniliophthora roreri (strain MCA 2997) TaxID=1381753 RepID=V2X4U3_MONRO|nr:hypothetical protein Moror_15350 [Moniliophthora roreri MCA 2997]